MKFIFSCIILLALAGCSSITTYSNEQSFSKIQDQKTYRVRVKTATTDLSKLTYQYVLQEFGKYITISESDHVSDRGTIDVEFSSSTYGFVSSGTVTHPLGIGLKDSQSVTPDSEWYTGSKTTTGAATDSSGSSGLSWDYQDSLMTVVISSSSGERLWSAEYNYKGGWELSGWVINTPEDAARHCVKKLAQKYAEEAGF